MACTNREESRAAIPRGGLRPLSEARPPCPVWPSGSAEAATDKRAGEGHPPFPAAVSDPVVRNPCFGMVMFQCTEPATKDTCRGVNPRRALLRHGQPPEAWLTLKQRRCPGFIKHCQYDTEKISMARLREKNYRHQKTKTRRGCRDTLLLRRRPL